jgi:hypothetical protein
MTRSNHFVEYGYQLARAALEPGIRAAVAAEFAERLAVASLSERWRLRREMAREIERRLRKMAPPDALY